LQVTAITSALMVIAMAILVVVVLRHVRSASEPEPPRGREPDAVVATPN